MLAFQNGPQRLSFSDYQREELLHTLSAAQLPRVAV